jgi:tryptophan synthase beta chain
MSQVLPLPARGLSPREAALRDMLRRNPADRVARIKLLELHFEQGREDEFLREATQFRNEIKGNLDATDWEAIRSIGLRMFPDAPVFTQAIPGLEPHRRLGEDPRSRPLFLELGRAYEQVRDDQRFTNDLDRELLFVARRPTPLVHARRLSSHFGGAQIYFKREDTAPAGMHLHINIVGQALLAQRLGKTKLVTGTVYGQRGVLVAETAARLGMKAVVYVDGERAAKEPSNIFRMWLTGAEIQTADASRLRGQDIREAALEYWIDNADHTMFMMGVDHGPDPYPLMARDFSAVIGRECRRQMLAITHRAPDLVAARAGDTPDAIGLFQPFLNDPRVRLACVETRKDLGPASGHDADLSPQQRRLSEAILDPMEYPSLSREHRWLRGTGRVENPVVDEAAVRQAITLMSNLEGLIPAIQTAHVVAWACAQAGRMKPDQSVVIAICEQADKDLARIGRSMGVPL